jgi:hypothetical protein
MEKCNRFLKVFGFASAVVISWLSVAQDIRSPNLIKREFIPTLIFQIERGHSSAQGKNRVCTAPTDGIKLSELLTTDN